MSGADRDMQVFSVAEIDSNGMFDDLKGRPALIYGWSDCPEQGKVLERLTDGAFVRAAPVMSGPRRLRWGEKASELAAELGGMDLCLEVPSRWLSVFEQRAEANDSGIDHLACLDGRPWFVRVRRSGDDLYLLGVSQLPDPDTVIHSAEQELPLVSAAIAVLLYARLHFPQRSWFPSGAYGNFIIDDPLLRPSYGFLCFEDLARRVEKAKAAATVAFIPWNAARSAKHTIEVLARTPGLSLCAHGYEHRDAEFSNGLAEDLEWRAHAAMDGMRRHEMMTGLGFEPVMVFPQGCFSADALSALARAGFVAAVNSTCLATDRTAVVRLSDVLEPAIGCYGSIPLFRRRAPSHRERFRYDVILGKPVLLVEHHGYFRDGGHAFSEVIEEATRLRPEIQWLPLGEIAKRVHLWRHSQCGTYEIRFYSRRFVCRSSEEGGRYTFVKPGADGAHIRRVTVGGRPVPFEVTEGSLRFSTDVDGTQDVVVVVEERDDGRAGAGMKRRRRLPDRVGVAVRRYAAELRDQYADTSPHLGTAIRVFQRLRQSR